MKGRKRNNARNYYAPVPVPVPVSAPNPAPVLFNCNIISVEVPGTYFFLSFLLGLYCPVLACRTAGLQCTVCVFSGNKQAPRLIEVTERRTPKAGRRVCGLWLLDFGPPSSFWGCLSAGWPAFHFNLLQLL